MANTLRIAPARVRFVDHELECNRLRTYGHRATCLTCGWTHVYRTVREARAQLADHKLETHGSTD